MCRPVDHFHGIGVDHFQTVGSMRLAIRETGVMLASLPPIPDPAKEALERGEPAVVVAERVKARGMFWLGFWFCVGMVAAVLVAAAAYLKRHRLLPTRR